MDTNKTRNLELKLLSGADFAKFLAMEDFRLYELQRGTTQMGLDSDQWW